MESGADSPEIAFYGGSFDPPHVGHVLAAAYALAVGGFSRLLVVPAFAHAFDKESSAFDDRAEMARLAFADLPRAEVTRIEERLGAPSRSLHTLEILEAEHPGARFRLVVGSDVLEQRRAWHRWDELVRRAPPFVLERAGTPSAEGRTALLPEVSSTVIRGRLRQRVGPSERDPALARLVPSAVLRYIDARGLYR